MSTDRFRLPFASSNHLSYIYASLFEPRRVVYTIGSVDSHSFVTSHDDYAPLFMN